MSLSISDVITPATAAQWLGSFLSNAATVGLSTTSWQSGGIARTILALLSNMMSSEDALVSMASQGGFLDFAGTGTVTYTNPSGTTVTVPVTPDPSIPSQWSTPGVPPLPGWLDFLADSTYNCQRIQAAAASGLQYFANTSGTPSSNYPIGTYHVANPATGQTYSNTQALLVAASTVLGGTISSVGNASGLFQINCSGNHGLSSGNVVYLSGLGGLPQLTGFWAVNVISSTVFSLQASTYTGGYTSGGLVYSTQQATFGADNIGAVASTAAQTITVPVTTILGVVTTNLQAFNGTNVESNVALVARCRLKIQALSQNGPPGAYAFYALSAYQIYANATVGGTLLADALSAAITQALPVPNYATGGVTTYVANSGGAVSGATGLLVAGATNASPIQITVASTAGLLNGMNVSITGAQGNTAANGLWSIGNVTGTTFTLTGSSGNGAYASGGVIEGGDLGLVDALIQANVVPLGVISTTVSATAQPITVQVTVYIPAAYASTIKTTLSSAVVAYLASVPIGGFATGVPTPNTLPVQGVIAAILAAAPYIRDIVLTLNGSNADVAVGATSVVTLNTGGSTSTINTF